MKIPSLLKPPIATKIIYKFRFIWSQTT